MKRKIILAFAVVLFLIGATFFCLSNAKACMPESIKNDYDQIVSDLNNEKISESKALDKCAVLMDRISRGNRSLKREYADVLRDITKNQILFEDDDVFTIAKEYSYCFKMYKKGKENLGIQKIEIWETSDGNVLVFDYSALTMYSVRQMQEDDKEYSGDRLVDHNAEFGKYRIEINFYDIWASEAFLKAYPIDTVCKLVDVPKALKGKVNIRGTYIGDSGFTVYIGSDEMLDVQEINLKELNHVVGSESIKLNK